MSSCVKCGGTGVISKADDELAVECECALIRRLAASMPPYIRKARVTKEHFALPIVKAVKKSVFIKSAWADMKAVIKAVMMINPNTFVRITSDREVLDVYLGKKSRGNRGDLDGGATRKNRVDLEGDEYVYNSIEDLMKPADICVVRLNEIGYKNKAAPGALTEALSFRLDRDLPTWIVSDLDKPYTVGSFSYSEAVLDYILSSTVGFTIPRLTPRVQFDLEEAMGMTAPVVNVSSDAVPTGTANLVAKPLPRPGSVVATAPPPDILDVDPVEESPRFSKPTRQGRIKPSEDMDAPRGLGLYGQGITPSRKMRKGD